MRRTGLKALVLSQSIVASSACAQTFNMRVDPFGQDYGETAFSVEAANDSNYVVIASVPFNDGQFYYSAVVTSMVVDHLGEVLTAEHVWYPPHATYPGWSNSSDRRVDGGIVVGGNTLRADSAGNLIRRAALFMVAPDGSMEGLYEVGPENQSWIGRQAKQTPDEGYVICGETSAVGNALQAFVIKTDAQGNEEWTQNYGGQWNDFILSVDGGLNGGYFTGGSKNISSGNAQFWVQSLGTSGSVVWEKIWGGGFSESTANISTAQNGDILVAGGWAYNNAALARRYLARLDPVDGSFIWQREYAAQAVDVALQVVKEVEPSMDLITVGSMAGPGAQYFGTILRTTNTGDSLWMRHYQYNDSVVSNGSGILRDVMPTPDGGFIAVGSALQTGPYTQDVWVIKTDSMGCLEPGCNLIQGMDTQITNLRGALSVAPNPVASGGNVQVSAALPENFTAQGNLRLTVVGSDGRLVHERTMQGTAGQLTTDNLRPGLYHVHLSDATRWISGAKLIVE